MKPYIYWFALILLCALTLSVNSFFYTTRYDHTHSLLSAHVHFYDKQLISLVEAQFNLLVDAPVQNQEPETTSVREVAVYSWLIHQVFCKKTRNQSQHMTMLYAPFDGMSGGIGSVLGRTSITTRELFRCNSLMRNGLENVSIHNYSRATVCFDTLLSVCKKDHTASAIVLLYRAFCFVKMQSFKEASADLQTIVQLNSQKDAVLIASNVLSWLQAREELEQKAFIDSVPLFERAKHRYACLEYHKAALLFHEFCGVNLLASDPLIQQAYFYLARCLEETYRLNEAAALHLKIIQDNPNSLYSLQALRRLSLLSVLYNQSDTIVQAITQVLVQNNDSEFVQKLSEVYLPFNSGRGGDTLPAPGFPPLKLESVVAALKTIQKQKNEIHITRVEEQSGDMQERVSLQGTGYTFSGRDSGILSNPFRNPRYIRQSIEAKVPQLSILYTNILKKDRFCKGRMLLKIVIKTDGSTDQSTVVSSTLANPSLENSIVNEVKKWNFQKIENHFGNVTINYPLEFFPDTSEKKIH